ncbi:MAG: hypothetical protein K2V38_27530 [Gemmataceae bacterium]|nr:hypothetical protein [Gemmataceae bacterium]
MRTLFTVAALVALAGALGAQDKKDLFESKDGRFVAKFPADKKPEVSTQKAGDLSLTVTMTESKDKAGFAVIYTDMPASILKEVKAEELLKGAEKGLVDNFKVTVSKSGEAKVTGGGKEYPAREVVGTKDTGTKDELHLRLKVALADCRLYQVFVVGGKDAVTGKAADEFLQSFALIEAPKEAVKDKEPTKEPGKN